MILYQRSSPPAPRTSGQALTAPRDWGGYGSQHYVRSRWSYACVVSPSDSWPQEEGPDRCYIVMGGGSRAMALGVSGSCNRIPTPPPPSHTSVAGTVCYSLEPPATLMQRPACDSDWDNK